MGCEWENLAHALRLRDGQRRTLVGYLVQPHQQQRARSESDSTAHSTSAATAKPGLREKTVQIQAKTVGPRTARISQFKNATPWEMATSATSFKQSKTLGACVCVELLVCAILFFVSPFAGGHVWVFHTQPHTTATCKCAAPLRAQLANVPSWRGCCAVACGV